MSNCPAIYLRSRSGTELRCENLADLIYLVNSFDHDFAYNQYGMSKLDKEWSVHFADIRLSLVDGFRVVYHYVNDMNIYLIAMWHRKEKIHLGSIMTAYNYLIDNNFKDRIKWKSKCNDKIVMGDPFSWMKITGENDALQNSEIVA